MKNRIQQAIETQDNLVEAYYYLGVAYERLHQDAEARNAFSQALELQPDNRKIREALGGLDT